MEIVSYKIDNWEEKTKLSDKTTRASEKLVLVR